ncbi:MAG TPA: ABC transporter substrate-binding protein [Gemmataceae bacterium]|jgi:ABC-type transport system substrate-binding protein
MSILSRRASLVVARTSLAVLALSFAVLGAWTTSDLRGQQTDQKKTRTEEEEETPKKPKRKVIRVPDEDDNKAKSETEQPAKPATSGDLAQLAEQAKHPALKSLFRSLAVPHDYVVFQRTNITTSGERSQRVEKIVPTPFYLGKDPGRFRRERFRWTPYSKDWQQGKPFEPLVDNLESVTPYEDLAQDAIKSFLRENYAQRETDDPLYLSRYAMLTAAEQVLSSVLRWHESAIQTGKREGKEWNDVEKRLRGQILEVLLEQMKVLAKANKWEQVLDLTHRVAKSYGTTDERIFQPVAEMIQSALNSAVATEEQKRETFKRLHELEMEFPDNRAFQPLSNMLRTRAKDLLDTAERLAKDKEDAQKLQRARELLAQADETWPQLPGLGELRAQIGMDYPILRVGVRGPLPKYFSPAWACTDAERRAVEMLFESLVKLVPDESGGFVYRQGLAESPPKVVPLGRQFDLPRNAEWSDGRRLNGIDIRESLGLLKIGRGVGRSRVWGELLEKAEAMRDPYQVTLRMKQGFLIPLDLMTFKILPRDEPQVTMEQFAIKPITSGPFRLDPLRRSDELRREYQAFVANPSYGRRLGKQGMPHIQEVRFYSYANNTDLAKELNGRKFDLVLDLTAKEAADLVQKQNGNFVVPMPSQAVPNRRIYFLAVNTKRLEDPKLRQALSSAIDREGLLNKHFRADLKVPLHKVLNGPFPAGSWACKPENEGDKSSQKLFDPDRAKLLRPQGRISSFKLKYVADDPAVTEAMKDLCAQVKDRTGVVLEPTPCTPYKLCEDVEKTKDFELAYYHYDFPDESYWLAPLMGTPPGTEDTNMFKFQQNDLTSLLVGTRSFRNFDKFQKYQWSMQDLLNRELPFIPLWQLDPLLAYRREVDPVALDPLLVFSNIEEWRLLRK